jgi:glycosyltransferase involved in cell wall biosynthesis
MDLIYFYPELDDSPANVGKSILSYLLDNANLPFESIKIFKSSNTVQFNDLHIEDLETINLSDLLDYKKRYIVHIPISPNIFPNKKLLLQLFCIISNKPLIIHYHGDIRKHFITKLKQDKKIDLLELPSTILMPTVLKKSTIVVTHSNLLNDVLIQNYGLENSIVIPNGLHDYWFEPIKKDDFCKKYPLDNNTYKIFYHGRLSSEKGIDLLIEATGRYIKDNTDTVLYIAGEGDQKEYLYNLSYKLGISSKVMFLGNVEKEVIKYYLSQVDIAIYPSRFDNFPLSMLEAMACAKCPVYLSTNSGICDFIRKDGFKIKLIEPSVESIYEAFSCKQYDLNLIKSQNMFAQKYRWKNVIKSYLDLYAKMSE